jgi:hypothetical protein
MRKIKTAIMLALVAAVGMASQANAAPPTANGTATFNITIPGAASLIDLATNNNAGSFPALTAAPNGAGTAMIGSTTDSWKMITNGPNGATVSSWVTGLAGPAALQADVFLTCADAGGPKPTTAVAPFTGGGQALATMSTASPGTNMTSTAVPGQGNFTMTLTVNAPFADGNGVVSGTINMLLNSN